MSGQPRGRSSSLALVLVGFLTANSFGQEGPLDIEPEDFRPGLIADYRSIAEPDARAHRIEPRPAFHPGESNPHERIPPGLFEVRWSGVLQIRESEPLRFSAIAGGEVVVVLDGQTVLEGRTRTGDGALTSARPIERRPGFYRCETRFRSVAGIPARLQLFWEGATFSREPLPAWRLGHLAGEQSPEASHDLLAARGRTLVGRLGCARCHASAFPSVEDPPPGPSLGDSGRRLNPAWLRAWLDNPSKLKPSARMPALFSADRAGFVERWILAESLGRTETASSELPSGDHRAGRLAFLGSGCIACHLAPEQTQAEQPDLDRWSLEGLGDRFTPSDLAAFLTNPHGRYPDGRMPRIPLGPDTARDVAAYLLLWSKPTTDRPGATGEPPTAAERSELAQKLGARNNPSAITVALWKEKGCTACHVGLGPSTPKDAVLRAGQRGGCLTGEAGPRLRLDDATRQALTAYLTVAGRERFVSPFTSGRHRLERAGCVRCHQRDSDRPPPLEVAAASLGGGFLQTLPFQRAPRLTDPIQKFTRSHLMNALREGVEGLRPTSYTYKMPSYGTEADALLLAIAEADGEGIHAADPVPRTMADPTAATVNGPILAGSQGYGCISCHVWDGRQFAQPDPGAVGPDLTRVRGRIRPDWFERYLDDPARVHPGTPMPAIFQRGKPAQLSSILDGDSSRQKDALWAYLNLGKDAPAPKPPPPLPIEGPAPGSSPIVGLIPVRPPTGPVVESLTLLFDGDDLVVYDLNAGELHGLYVGGRILRDVQARLRRFLIEGQAVWDATSPVASPKLEIQGTEHALIRREFQGHDRLTDGTRLRWTWVFEGARIAVEETIRREGRTLVRSWNVSALPEKSILRLTLVSRGSVGPVFDPASRVSKSGESITATMVPEPGGTARLQARYGLPAPRKATLFEGRAAADPGRPEGSLERPGYRARVFPRPKTASGEDRVMPGAVAVEPETGRVHIVSLKTGELLTADPTRGDVEHATFENRSGGLFQDAYSMRAEPGALYILHRRNLTRLTEPDGDGRFDRFDRVAALPHGVADTYDYPYGLTRGRDGRFVVSYAPYANTTMPGSGGAVRLAPDGSPEELAFGMRNPVGWCNGPEGEIFFTDNQGEWVPANKLTHLERGRFYGFPNPAQRQHAEKPEGRAAVFVPYGWARSINGVTYDHTGGKFGPFAGQFFLAELMFGGAIIRADLERVNGQYQGACFPFWGKGLLGPLSLAFDDKRGHLYVGGINEPGWMAQPDRGALFRVEFTGETPFEMRTIRVLTRGFRIEFTTPVNHSTAEAAGAYHVEHYRYEKTGAYGSPELDRTNVRVRQVEVAADGRSVLLTTDPLVAGRVYMIRAEGVRSTAGGQSLVHSEGAYTLNEIPAEPR